MTSEDFMAAALEGHFYVLRVDNGGTARVSETGRRPPPDTRLSEEHRRRCAENGREPLALDTARIAELRRQGLSWLDVGKALGCSTTAVRNALARIEAGA